LEKAAELLARLDAYDRFSLVGCGITGDVF